MSKTECYRLVVDIWRYFSEFWDPLDTDGYFAGLTSAGDALWIKYNKDPLLRDVLTAYMKSREEKLKHEIQKR